MSDTFADTPEPPYVAVIFTSTRPAGPDRGYAAMSQAMWDLVEKQPGFLGAEAARDGVGITVSYWVDAEAAQNWKRVAQHLAAQRRGRDVWYDDYRVRIATVERDYSKASSEFESERHDERREGLARGGESSNRSGPVVR